MYANHGNIVDPTVCNTQALVGFSLIPKQGQNA